MFFVRESSSHCPREEESSLLKFCVLLVAVPPSPPPPPHRENPYSTRASSNNCRAPGSAHTPRHHSRIKITSASGADHHVRVYDSSKQEEETRLCCQVPGCWWLSRRYPKNICFSPQKEEGNTCCSLLLVVLRTVLLVAETTTTTTHHREIH